MMRQSTIAAATLGIVLACAIAACSGTNATLTNPAAPSPPPGPSNDTGHYAGTYYPLYNHNPREWQTPERNTPFDKVSEIFAAFAHAYDKGNGGIASFEEGQPDEAARLKLLEDDARAKNPKVRVLITLGWGKGDWNPIAKDYKNNAGLFVPSVVALVRDNHLDGFDIDDESIGPCPKDPRKQCYKSGDISQADFDAVVGQLRSALDAASKQDHHSYALVITPAGDNASTAGVLRTNIDAANVRDFDWVNIQSYFPDNDSKWGRDMVPALEKLIPAKSIAVGINTEGCSPGGFPPYDGLKGIFDWSMTADKQCDYKYTGQIATDVGYP